LTAFTSSPIAMIFTSVLLGTAGQLFLKSGMSGMKIGAGISGFAAAIRAIPNPKVLTGFLLYGLSSIIWLVILNRVKLSVAYPMISMSYVFVVLLSALVFRERITPVMVLGLFLICGGVTLIGLGLSAPK